MSDEAVSSIEQRLFKRADGSCRKVVQALLNDLRQMVFGQDLRYRKVVFSGGMVVNLTVSNGDTYPVDVGEILDALEHTLFMGLRDKMRQEEVDAFIARVEKSK